MDRLEALINTIADEDRRLQDLVGRLSPGELDQPGVVGRMSAKETLGHLAFWDAFTVRFFEARFSGQRAAAGLDDFEERDRQELRRLRGRPFTDVLKAYREATTGLMAFLRVHWPDLSDRERADIVTPLRHRRHHRMLLERAVEDPPPRAESGRA